MNDTFTAPLAPLAPPATPTPPPAAEISAAAASAVCNDPAISELLRRKSTGEKLTASEHGRIGNWKQRQRLQTLTGGTPLAAPSPAPSLAPPAPGAPVGLAAPEGVPAPFTERHAALVRGTVESILEKANYNGKRQLRAAAKAAGADAENLERYSRAEIFGESDRKVLSDTSPLVCEAAGIDPTKIPIYTFFGTAITCAFNFWAIIAELKEMQAHKPPAKP